jgi:hypothetical protein
MDTTPDDALTDAQFKRAAARWGKFFASTDEIDRAVLDRYAVGETLKTICFDLDLSYDTVQKRISRWQDALCLPSTSTLLHLWMTLRKLGRKEGDPTMLRYAELLCEALGYNAELTLPDAVELPPTMVNPLGSMEVSRSLISKVAQQRLFISTRWQLMVPSPLAGEG